MNKNSNADAHLMYKDVRMIINRARQQLANTALIDLYNSHLQQKKTKNKTNPLTKTNIKKVTKKDLKNIETHEQ